MEHQVRFRVRGKTRCVTVADGTSLLAAVQMAGLPIARACGGEGLCARCGVLALVGAETLSAQSPAEADAKAHNRVPEELRLACQARVHGPVVARASYW